MTEMFFTFRTHQVTALVIIATLWFFIAWLTAAFECFYRAILTVSKYVFVLISMPVIVLLSTVPFFSSNITVLWLSFIKNPTRFLAAATGLIHPLQHKLTCSATLSLRHNIACKQSSVMKIGLINVHQSGRFLLSAFLFWFFIIL